MTNLDVIKFFAESRPWLLSEFLNTIYAIAWNQGSRDVWDDIWFGDEWLDSECDEEFFDKRDLEDIL